MYRTDPLFKDIPASTLQSFLRVFIRQLEYGDALVVDLYFESGFVKDGSDQPVRIITDLS